MTLKVDKFLFCLNLKTGNLIIAYMRFILCFVFIILSFTYYKKMDTITGVDVPENLRYTHHVFYLIVLFLNQVFNIVLLVGLHKEKRGLIKTYLIFGLVATAIATIGYILHIVTGATTVFIVRFFFAIMINLYFLLVLRSYYLELGETSQRQPICNEA